MVVLDFLVTGQVVDKATKTHIAHQLPGSFDWGQHWRRDATLTQSRQKASGGSATGPLGAYESPPTLTSRENFSKGVPSKNASGVVMMLCCSAKVCMCSPTSDRLISTFMKMGIILLNFTQRCGLWMSTSKAPKNVPSCTRCKSWACVVFFSL